jgi:transposase
VTLRGRCKNYSREILAHLASIRVFFTMSETLGAYCVDGFNAAATIDDKGCDAELYKERNIFARFFNNLKQFRSVATGHNDRILHHSGGSMVAS